MRKLFHQPESKKLSTWRAAKRENKNKLAVNVESFRVAEQKPHPDSDWYKNFIVPHNIAAIIFYDAETNLNGVIYGRALTQKFFEQTL